MHKGLEFNKAVAVPNPAQRQLECIHVARQALGLLHIDDLPVEQLGEMLVEALRAGFLVADAGLELVELAIEDVFAHQWRGHHDFDDGHAAFAFALLGEALAQHRDEVQPELRLLEVFLHRIEQRDHTLDGHRRVGGVNGGEDEVAGVGGAQRGAERERVTDFADQDRVGVLAHHGAKGVLVALAVGADLDLRHQ